MTSSTTYHSSKAQTIRSPVRVSEESIRCKEKSSKIPVGHYQWTSQIRSTSLYHIWMLIFGQTSLTMEKTMRSSETMYSSANSTKSMVVILCSITSQPISTWSRCFIISSSRPKTTGFLQKKTKTVHSVFWILIHFLTQPSTLLSRNKDQGHLNSW